ncbi:hypothetical protein DDF65_04840 [Caulobacter radicis]|uniref:Uncharacterized protein n=1 Tax=Caulobacter radicis TaxID=2172650 RepID=A0A2T9JTS9_9CAUL|nr:hypothetical protein DDF65_04840 [Caulobacter radicis]
MYDQRPSPSGRGVAEGDGEGSGQGRPTLSKLKTSPLRPSGPPPPEGEDLLAPALSKCSPSGGAVAERLRGPAVRPFCRSA